MAGQAAACDRLHAGGAAPAGRAAVQVILGMKELAHWCKNCSSIRLHNAMRASGSQALRLALHRLALGVLASGVHASAKQYPVLKGLYSGARHRSTEWNSGVQGSSVTINARSSSHSLQSTAPDQYTRIERLGISRILLGDPKQCPGHSLTSAAWARARATGSARFDGTCPIGGFGGTALRASPDAGDRAFH